MLNGILVDDLKLKRAASGSCLYHYRDDDGWVLLCTEVGDLVITGTNEKKIESIRQTHLYLFLQDGSCPKKTLSYLRISENMTRHQARLFVVRQA